MSGIEVCVSLETTYIYLIVSYLVVKAFIDLNSANTLGVNLDRTKSLPNVPFLSCIF